MSCDDIVGSGPVSPLGASLRVGPFTIGNRFAIQPMEGWDGDEDGTPSANADPDVPGPDVPDDYAQCLPYRYGFDADERAPVKFGQSETRAFLDIAKGLGIRLVNMAGAGRTSQNAGALRRGYLAIGKNAAGVIRTFSCFSSAPSLALSTV